MAGPRTSAHQRAAAAVDELGRVVPLEHPRESVLERMAGPARGSEPGTVQVTLLGDEHTRIGVAMCPRSLDVWHRHSWHSTADRRVEHG